MDGYKGREFISDRSVSEHEAVSAAHHPAGAQTLQWGGLWDAVGNFIFAYSFHGNADRSSSAEITSCPVCIGGTINALAMVHGGDLSVNNATFKLWVNGVVKATVVATGGAKTVDNWTGLGVAVVAGDYVEIEYDAGATIPANSIVVAVVE